MKFPMHVNSRGNKVLLFHILMSRIVDIRTIMFLLVSVWPRLNLHESPIVRDRLGTNDHCVFRLRLIDLSV